MNMNAISRWTFTVLLLGAVSCGGSTQFLDPEADIPYYETVGIIPFVSLADDRAAGARVTNVFFTEVLKVEFARVVEPGQFAAAISRVRGNTPAGTPWSSEDLVRLQEEAGVQGVFMGTVLDYEMVREGRDSYPMVSMEVRLVDTASGRLVWDAGRTRKEGPGFPLFSWGRARTLPDLTAKLCRELLEGLP